MKVSLVGEKRRDVHFCHKPEAAGQQGSTASLTQTFIQLGAENPAPTTPPLGSCFRKQWRGDKIAMQEGSVWYQGFACLLWSGGITHQRGYSPMGCWVTCRVTVCGQTLLQLLLTREYGVYSNTFVKVTCLK